MNIVDLNQKETLAVSGGVSYTLMFANMFTIIGTSIGFLLILTKKKYYEQPHPNLASASSLALSSVFSRRGLRGATCSALLIAGSCAAGTLTSWTIVTLLSTANII